MPILKTTTTSAGAIVGYHRLRDFKFDANLNLALAHFEGWVDEAAYIAKKPIMWNMDIPVALSSLSGSNFVTSIEQTCILSGDLSGGTILADNADSLDGVKSRKIASLNEACSRRIVSGFHSDALGGDFLYPAKSLDQSNLTGSVLASLLPGNAADWTTPFWCADMVGVWAFRLHTAAQIQQVGIDAKNTLLAALGKNLYLASKVHDAVTIDEVNAVTY